MKKTSYYCDACGVEIEPHGVRLLIQVNGVDFLEIEHGCDDCNSRVKLKVTRAFHDAIENIKKNLTKP
jgi:DNA-directed RNA polymerase subunit RPC12/RpoP